MEISHSPSCSGSTSSCSRRLRSRTLLGWLGCGLLLAVFAPVSGCSEEDPARDVDACIEQSINNGKQANWIQGTWRMTATGERTDCADEAYNTEDLTVSAEGIRVHQQGHYVFLENTVQNKGFSLAGMVGDRCIHFRTSEETKYGLITFDMPAFFVSNATFKGSFRGTGPQGCKTTGTFTVYAKLDPLPAKASNPAPADAGTTQGVLCAACQRGCQGVDLEFMEECEDGCDRYICAIEADGGDAGDAPDGADPDAPDVVEEPVPDAGDDAEGDGPEEDAGDGGHEDAEGADALDDVESGDADPDAEPDAEPDADPDAESDAAPDAQDDAHDEPIEDEAGEDGTSSGGPEYKLWDGAVTIDLPDDVPGPGTCTATSSRSGPLAGWWLLAAGWAALAGRRRRR